MDQVTETLYITDMYGVQQHTTNQFDVIVSICNQSVSDNVNPEYYHWFELADGTPPSDAYDPSPCTYDTFKQAVDTIVQHLENNRCTLVHCHAGQSRSAMAVVAALTRVENVPFATSFDRVRTAREGGISPSPELYGFAEQYTQSHQS